MAKFLFILLLASSGIAQAGPNIETWQTSNGAQVYFVQANEIPMVQFAVGFDAGSARDPKDKQGLASLVNLLMDEGIDRMDAEQISQSLESVGADYGGNSARDSSVFQLRVLTEPKLINKAVDIFSRILAKPSFPENVIQRERKRIMVSLQFAKQSPRSIVSERFYAALYDVHPYGQQPIGTESGLASIERSDLVEFHRTHMVGANAVMAIVGDLDGPAARQWSERIFAGLNRGGKPQTLAPVAELIKQQTIHVEFPSQQSHLLFGQLGISYGDPDYFPLYLGNHILGGSGSISRLSTEIRENRGLVYGVSSSFIPMRGKGPFIVSLQTKNQQADEAERIVLETIQSFIDTGPTEDELLAAKNNIIGGFPLRIDSNSKIASRLLNLAFYDLPTDYLETFSMKVSEVTAKQIQDAFTRHVQLDKLIKVRVGTQIQ